MLHTNMIKDEASVLELVDISNDTSEMEKEYVSPLIPVSPIDENQMLDSFATSSVNISELVNHSLITASVSCISKVSNSLENSSIMLCTNTTKDKDSDLEHVAIPNDLSEIGKEDVSSFIPVSPTNENQIPDSFTTSSVNISELVNNNLITANVSCISKVSKKLENEDCSEMQNIKSQNTQLLEKCNIKTKTALEVSSKKINKIRQHVVSENQERINYLFQVSNYLNNIESANNFKNESASLGSMAMAIGRKCVLRLSPSLKRQLCKGCGSAILPAISSKYRLKNNRQKHLVVTCNKCKTIKRFVSNPNYELWSDNAESNASK